MTPTPAVPGAPLFRVTGQRETTQTTGAGQFIRGVEVSFTTRSGSMASIFVPYTSYAPDTVKQMLTERAQSLEAVHNLTAD